MVATLAHDQLLGLSRIPDLGTAADRGECAAVAPVATTTTTAPLVAPRGDEDDEEQGEAEAPPLNHWGEIEVHLDERKRLDRGGSMAQTARTFV